ncbi:MAG: N-6 DNA methylase [Bacteroidales bacterium]|nr:N-6 DNA methylase [Bacteroidales bacterium]
MTINEYIDKLNSRYRLGISTEHSYRAELQNLVESLAPDVLVTNEPARIKCGSPDYIITKGKIPVGYIEAKDIGKPLDSREFKEQFDRYRSSLSNLIITDYLEFRLFFDGSFVSSVTIGEVQGNKIVARNAYFEPFSDIIKNFCTHVGQTIKSASKLSKLMASKARLMANVIERALSSDGSGNQVNEVLNLNLHNQFEAFKHYLIHDITEKAFADIYSQTIAYGMFAARLNDPTLVDFSRFEAAELIPKSNPFLRNLFQYIAGYDLDDRIKWIVDELADVFRATDVADLLKDFGKSTGQNDPMIHFYETFLAEYDPKLRKSRGVYYTPEPVVNFIVRAVDDILKTEFGLTQGLADTSKVKIKIKDVSKATPDLRSKTRETEREEEVHRVQILDPAAGTGTFLAEVIKHIYKQFDGQQGIWSNYVEEHLIPRLNGFEILMASYAMAHLKLDLLLKETGFVAKRHQRLKVYLTNSLEEHHPETGTLFAGWLSTEANEANHVKRDTPVMVILGNPPYSGESQNKGDWIMNLMRDYKKEPGGIEKLNERNPKWINDDYVKFLRYGQYFIEKNGTGILAFINPHGFLDNPTFRGMRWNLLKTYDKIYSFDLHGNSKKKEKAPDNSADENVFDIMQGVSINLLIKTGCKKPNELGKVLSFDLFGKRNLKYSFLLGNTLKTVNYEESPNTPPFYSFSSKNLDEQVLYNEGFKVNELFIRILLGPNSHRDEFAIAFNKNVAEKRITDLLNQELNDDEIKRQYNLVDNRDWKLSQKRRMVPPNAKPIGCIYRPFDFRFMLYGEYAFDYHRPQVNDSLLNINNFGFVTTRQTKETFSAIITDKPLGQHKIVTPYDGSYLAPLYIYTITSVQQNIEQGIKRTPNLKPVLIKEIEKRLGLKFTNEKETTKGTFAPLDILDYIYSISYSPFYREKFKEFLKKDFPRIPYPKDQATFWQLVKLGGELRQIHLLESPDVNNYITSYPNTGTNEVGKVRNENGKVWINSEQYFDNVPQIAWEFYIGGYQPAQKWLKDRKGIVLSYDDIIHYQKIIVALSESDRIMKEIDLIPFLQ